MKRSIPAATQGKIKRHYQQGFSAKILAKQNGLTVKEVLTIVRGEQPASRFEEDSEAGRIHAACSMWRRNESKQQSERRRQVTKRAIIGNFADVNWWEHASKTEAK